MVVSLVTNLEVGTGDPWAGQVRQIDEPIRTNLNFKDSSPDNFGADPPIGSDNIARVTKSSNLNDGTGDPWAGHDKLNTSACLILIRFNTALPENFGTDPPIGSGMLEILVLCFLRIWEEAAPWLRVILKYWKYLCAHQNTQKGC